MKKRSIIYIAIGLGFFCLLPGLIFLIKFYSYPLSDNPEDWGNFGDYIGGVLSPIFALIGIFAATYIAIIANNIQVQQVKPVANIVVGNYVNDLYVDLRNGGLGTLIVRSLRVRNNVGDEKINIIGFMPELSPPKYWANYVSKIEGRAISPSDKINLIRYKVDSQSDYEIKMKYEIKKALSELTIEVEYSDIFGNSQSILIRNLTAFSKRDIDKHSNNEDKNHKKG